MNNKSDRLLSSDRAVQPTFLDDLREAVTLYAGDGVISDEAILTMATEHARIAANCSCGRCPHPTVLKSGRHVHCGVCGARMTEKAWLKLKAAASDRAVKEPDKEHQNGDESDGYVSSESRERRTDLRVEGAGHAGTGDRADVGEGREGARLFDGEGDGSLRAGGSNGTVADAQISRLVAAEGLIASPARQLACQGLVVEDNAIICKCDHGHDGICGFTAETGGPDLTPDEMLQVIGGPSTLREVAHYFIAQVAEIERLRAEGAASAAPPALEQLIERWESFARGAKPLQFTPADALETRAPVNYGKRWLTSPGCERHERRHRWV